MSAYICNPEHIGVLAAYAMRGSITKERIFEVQELAKLLMSENIRSVAYRYPNDEDGCRGYEGMKDKLLIRAAVDDAARFLQNGTWLPALHIIKLCDALEYQSCETPDYEHSFAYRQLMKIKSIAICNLPGYDEAPWSYD